MKLGRLIHSYQKFEALLKAAVARADVFGKGDELEENFRNLQTATSEQTLGQIANRLFDTIYGPPMEAPEPEVIDQPFMHTALRIEIKDPEVLERVREKFKAVIKDRNTVIHDTLKLDSDADCQALIDEIDRQREQLKPLYEEIRKLLGVFRKSIQAIGDNPDLLDPDAEPPETLKVGDTIFTQKPC